MKDVNVGETNRFRKYIEKPEDELSHHGVKGMHWGVRNAETQARYRRDGSTKAASFRTNRKAKRDAREFAEAKMYYGEGAGNRRKLIKNRVADRSKRLPGYSQAFETHLGNQNMDKAVSKAKSKRARTDAINATRKTGRGVVHALNGNGRYASAAALAIVGAARITGADKVVAEHVRSGAQAAVKAMRSRLKNRKI